LIPQNPAMNQAHDGKFAFHRAHEDYINVILHNTRIDNPKARHFNLFNIEEIVIKIQYSQVTHCS
jgi:hypothetical protein